MELQLASKGMEFTLKKKKWVALMAAFGLTTYGFYRVYHFPAIAQKRNGVFKLLGALVSITESISHCAETIGVVSKYFNGFLQSESNQIPHSLKQVSKIKSSNEFSQSISKVTQALTAGIYSGCKSEASRSSMDQAMDNLFTEAGAGFASAVVGSFARNLAMAACSERQQSDVGYLNSNYNSIPSSWLNVVCCGDEFRNLIGDCIQVFVSSMVCVYLEKTKDANTFDQFFSGLTNPNHETQVRNLLVTVSNVARLLKLTSTLAEPKNKKFVLDLSGRIAFETARSFLQALLEVLSQGMQKCVKFAHETVVRGGLEIVRYVPAKSSVVAAVSLSLCLHIIGGVWILVPV
ncbi:Detected protein of unknown function [Hibiscus syriacus]|uniref:Protein PHLOEM PROTEIN 2-LIKE A10 n=1 Tax=Hibiscus syriacus TaxID=106335 RepID=A0A6A2YIT9_HIBSY|nr:Detected protein of unknown function [Hibiscus syriacus]